MSEHAWRCDVCGTLWLENPVPELHGCPECGGIPVELLDPEPNPGLFGWLRDFVGWLIRPAAVETWCGGDWAIAVRGIFDRELRCTRCGAAIPGPTHPIIRASGR